jgi:hypothetical protein
MSKTRVVRLRPGVLRADDANTRTAVGVLPTPAPFDPQGFFTVRYDAIRRAVARYPKQGVLVLAFDHQGEHEPLGELWLEASLDRARAAIFGRHSLCDLMVPQDRTSVSLRHLAIIVRAVDLHDVRVRFLDLMTGLGFQDEAGRRLQAVSADGPAFLRVEDVILVTMRTPEPGGLPDDPHAGYACLPARVFLDEVEGAPSEEPRRTVYGRNAGDQTIVRSRSGPMIAARDLCGEDDVPRGVLTLRSGGATARWRVGTNVLDRGVLIGRYERCHLGTIDRGEAGALSRVHLLVVADGDDVLAIDTASTNGTLFEGKEKRIVTLRDGDVLSLGGELDLTWNSEV